MAQTTPGTIRAYRLLSGGWHLERGRRISVDAREYQKRGLPCFTVRDGQLVSATPATQRFGRELPGLMLTFLDLLAAEGIELAPDVATWLAKIARVAQAYGACWVYRPHRRGKSWYDDVTSNFYAEYGAQRHFSTGPICGQYEFVAALHEIGHLDLNGPRDKTETLPAEVACWEFAFAQAEEELLPNTLDLIMFAFISYLIDYRRRNLRRVEPWPVPQAARSFVARYRRYYTTSQRLPLAVYLNGTRQRGSRALAAC